MIITYNPSSDEMGIIWRILIEYTESIIITILFMAIIVILSYLGKKI